MHLYRMLHKRTRRAMTLLVVVCVLAAGAVGSLALWTQSLTAMALSALMLPALLLTWRIYRTVLNLQDQAHSRMEQAQDAEQHYFTVLSQVMAVVEGRDRYLAGRSERIASLTGQMASQLGLDADRSRLLSMIGRVHDIGLLAVPPDILNKATGLSGSEYGVIKKHCQVGCHMLEPLTFLKPVLNAVLHHHERMNGTGYPDGLRGKDIPLEARILAVADSYDAMTHDRPHRRSLSNRQAVAELIRCADAGYDRTCVIALASIVSEEDLLPPEWAAQPAADTSADAQACPVLAGCGG